MPGPSPQLIALFNNVVENAAPLFVARLYTITLFGGGQLRFTDADCDVMGVSPSVLVNGFTYASGGVRIDQLQSKTQAHLKVGLDTDTWTVVLMPRPFDVVTGAAFPDTIGSVPFLQAAQAGALGSADFQVDEAYFAALPTWPMPAGGAVPVGCRTIFAGTLAEVDCTNALAVLTVNDYRSLLTLSMPRHFYQAQCRHTLFDVGCTLNAANFAVNGVAAAGSTQAAIVAAGIAKPKGSKTYTLGKLVFTGGLNKTFSRFVKSWDGESTLSLLNPLPFAVSPGDTFTAYPGCDKSFGNTTGCAGFANQVNYGGQPFIPAPEVA